jgi:hypothetical protein
LFPA